MIGLDFVRKRIFSRVAVAALASVLIWALAPANVLAATLAPGVGFDIGSLPGVDLVIDDTVELIDANEPPAMGTAAVELSGSMDLCILVGSSTTCQPTIDIGTAAPVSFLVTYTVSAINTSLITGPFTLLLTDLNSALGYSRSDITLDIAPAPIPALDTSLVPDFFFDPTNGVNGFDPFIVVQDDFFGAGNEQYYVGWTVMLGDTVTFKFDLNGGVIGASTPGFETAAIPVVVPEPGTALLMGLGLAALARSSRRGA